jgi:hypothetical protein
MDETTDGRSNAAARRLERTLIYTAGLKIIHPAPTTRLR